MSLSIEDVPFLNRISRVDLARILPEIREVTMFPGEVLDLSRDADPSLYAIRSGEVQVMGTDGVHDVAVGVLAAGDFFGEEGLFGVSAQYHVKSATEVRLFRMPCSRINGLLRNYPDLNRDLLQALTRRLAANHDALCRAKVMLNTYSMEFWGGVDQEIALAGAALAEAPEKESAVQVPPKKDIEWPWSRGLKGLGFVAAFVVAAIVYLVLRSRGWSPPLMLGSAVVVWALLNWMLDTMPDYVVAMAAISAVVAAGATPVPTALSGFANATWFLSLAVLGIGTAIARSGLLFRIALHMLKLLPPTYWGQSLALALAGLVLTPVLPSPSGRVALASPLAMELAEAMRFPERSKGSAGLGMSVLLGFGQMYFMFLNGTGSCVLLWSLLPAPIRQQINWGYWLLAALPLGLVVFLATFLAIMWLFRPEQTVVVSREVLSAQLATLGPMSRLERTTLGVVSVVLLAFITQPWHGVDPTWVALAGLLFLIAVGAIDRDTFRKGIDWNFLVLYGGLIGLAAILDHIGLSSVISQELAVAFRPLLAYPALFLTSVALATTLLRVAMPMVAAALMMAVTLYPLAVHAGVNPFVLTLTIQVASNPWFLPHQNTFYQTAVAGTDGRAFTHGQVRNLAALYAVITVVSVPLMIPFWRLLGLVP